MKKLHIAAAALYFGLAIITFGHAAAQSERRINAEVAKCEQRTPNALCWDSPATPGASGVLAAMLWPLYWSWEAWK